MFKNLVFYTIDLSRLFLYVDFLSKIKVFFPYIKLLITFDLGKIKGWFIRLKCLKFYVQKFSNLHHRFISTFLYLDFSSKTPPFVNIKKN